jgi:KDO2-lipid IV(A) lauroyltransferase
LPRGNPKKEEISSLSGEALKNGEALCLAWAGQADRTSRNTLRKPALKHPFASYPVVGHQHSHATSKQAAQNDLSGPEKKDDSLSTRAEKPSTTARPGSRGEIALETRDIRLAWRARLILDGFLITESPEKHPKRWKWRLEWLAYACIQKLAGILPGAWVFRFGELLGHGAWYLMRRRRQIVLRNLRIAFCGEHELPILHLMARQTFIRTAANLLSSSHTAALSGREIGEVLTIENHDLIEKAMSGTAGLVLMPAHMGNWEVLSRMNRVFPQGHAIGAFYRPLNNPLMDARVVAQRETDGTRLFSKRDNLHHVTGFLREGSLVGILADQRVGRQGELVQFFGRLTRASPLPSLMARRSKSELLTMSLITEAPGKWRVRYHPVASPHKTADCMAALELAMRASPLDVFWLQDRWKVYLDPNYTIRDWLGADSVGGEKAHRALVWMADCPPHWRLPAEWTHPDVNYEIVISPGQDAPEGLPAGSTIHRNQSVTDRDALQRLIGEIDLKNALPVDFILTCDAPAVLAKAAHRAAIPLVSLPAPA